MSKFEDLIIWQDAKSLALTVYQLMKDNKDFGFKDQIQRAAISIMNNISEGADSGSDTMFIRYLHIAKGSCAEVRSMLHLCEELGYCDAKLSVELIEQTKHISAGLVKLIEYLSTSKGER